MNKQKKERRTKQKITPKPLKFNGAFYILGIVFSALIVLGILASIPILATKDYQKVNNIFYILDPNPEVSPYDIFIPTDANLSALLYGHTSGYFSGIGYSCIELSNDT